MPRNMQECNIPILYSRISQNRIFSCHHNFSAMKANYFVHYRTYKYTSIES